MTSGQINKARCIFQQPHWMTYPQLHLLRFIAPLLPSSFHSLNRIHFWSSYRARSQVCLPQCSELLPPFLLPGLWSQCTANGNEPFSIRQTALQSGEAWPDCSTSAETHPACPSPPCAQAPGGWRARGRTTALWEGEERQWAGSLRAFRPAEGCSLLGRRPVPTFVTQPSTALLLLKLSCTSFLTSRRVSSKRGHLCFQVLISSVLPPGRLQSLLLLSLHRLTWSTASVFPALTKFNEGLQNAHWLSGAMPHALTFNLLKDPSGMCSEKLRNLTRSRIWNLGLLQTLTCIFQLKQLT